MAMDVSRVDVWVGEIADEPGGVSAKLEALADAGADLEFVIARRAPDKPGTGVVFLAPVKGAAQIKAAKAAGLKKSATMAPLRVAGPDKPGIGARLTRLLAEAGVNLRGLSAARMGRKVVLYLSFDNKAASAKAAKVLRRA